MPSTGRIAPRAWLVAVAVALTLAVTAAPALAATQWDSLEVALHDGEKGTPPIVMASGTLLGSVKLPAQVRLSVPKGARILWVGELLGGPGMDREAAYSVEDRGSYQIVSLPVNASRKVQVEAAMPRAASWKGANRRLAFAWTPADSANSSRLAIRVPITAKIMDTTVGLAEYAGEDGYVYKALERSPVVGGEEQRISVTIDPPGFSFAGFGVATFAFVAGLVFVGAVLAMALRMQKHQRAGAVVAKGGRAAA